MLRLAPCFAGAAVGSALTLFVTALFPAASIPFESAASPAVGAGSLNSLKLFDSVFATVRADYVDKPDDARLIDAAIKGMLSGLDPHSSYLDAESFRDMQAQTSGKFGGVGMVVSRVGASFKVISSIDDTPAARAGVLGGDLLAQVDGKPLQGLTLTQVAEKLRGPAGTTVRVELLRDDTPAPIELTLTRQIIKLHSVDHRVEGDDIGYIRISQFDDLTTTELKRAIGDLAQKIRRDRLKGYILDLRNDPGGLLDQAVSVSATFLPGGEVVSIRGRDAVVQRFDARGGDLTQGSPLVVLINGGSASASEIVAGALQDHKRGTIVGSQSFGKGSVQTIIPLGKRDGALRLTTGRYYTPSGRSLQATGITPDIAVAQPIPAGVKDPSPPISEAGLRDHLTSEGPEKSGSPSFIPADPNDDRALQEALKLLRGTVADAASPPGQAAR
jgi:carboxyl-terminal processing protease